MTLSATVDGVLKPLIMEYASFATEQAELLAAVDFILVYFKLALQVENSRPRVA